MRYGHTMMGGIGSRRVSRRTTRALLRAWIAAAGFMLVALAGVTAHGAWRAVAARGTQAGGASIAVPTAPVADPPGLMSRDAGLAAPGAGSTGTIVLPPLPVAPAPAASITTAGARPFALGDASPLTRARAMECLTAAIFYEAASEPEAGQRAVAQVILNRVRHRAFPASVCGVVYQGSERRGCQFSFACDGAMARVPSRAGWARAARVAAGALGGLVYAPVGLATHYHTYAVTPAWNRALVMTDAEGAHFFHRWKGWWGTAAAFGQPYAGIEPVPGPHAAVPVAAVATMADPALARAVAAAATWPMPPVPTGVAAATVGGQAPPRTAAPRPAPSATPPVAERFTGTGEMLDRWAGTGQPLR